MFADPENGYRLKCFNTIDFSASMHYNPLAYVRTDSDVLSFVNCFIANTDGDGTPGDPFWGDSMRLLLTALIFFLRDWCAPKFYSLSGLLTLLSLAEAREGDESFKSPLDLLFLQIETGKKFKKREGGPRPASASLSRDAVAVGSGGSAYIEVPSQFERRGDHVRPADRGGLTPDEDIALGYYNDFRVAAGKTLKSILITCNTRLARVRLREVREILKDDEMELDKMGDPDRPKTALIACMSDTNKSFSFLHAIMMWQTINLLCNRAAIDYHGKLPVPVNFIFDEFANIGTIPDMSFFNRPTNVGFDNRIIDFNLRELPDSMLVFALINVCEAVRNRMYHNYERGVRTWLYVEEIQSLFAYPTVLNYFSRFANEGRKFGLLLTGITQNAVAMLNNEAAQNIVLNSDFLMLLKQSPVDRLEWSSLLNLSEQEEECIDESVEPGDGLLIAGAARIPIRGKFPDKMPDGSKNPLYALFSTNPNEE